MSITSIFSIPLRSLAIILILSLPVLSENTPSLSVSNATDTVIINEVTGPPDSSSDAIVNYLNYQKINEWALTLKMTAINDNPPVTDGIAFFPVHPQVEIPVKGLKKGERYFLYIDFVKYLNGKVNIDSTLKIFIQDIYGKRTFISQYRFSSLFSDKIFKAEIPFNLSNPGSFTIIIQEQSAKTGYWGIWDIIVSSRGIEDIAPLNIDKKPEIKETGPKIFK